MNFFKDMLYEALHGSLNRQLANSCAKGDFERVKALLTNPDMKDGINIHSKNDKALLNACRSGNLDIVKFLLTSPDIKEHADIKANDYEAFTWACHDGHIDIIKYMLKCPDLKENVDLKCSSNLGIDYACLAGQMPVIKYLLVDPELKDKARLDDWTFIMASHNAEHNREAINYLLCDMNFPVTDQLRKNLKKYMTEEKHVILMKLIDDIKKEHEPKKPLCTH